MSCEVASYIRSEIIFIYLKRHYTTKHEKTYRKYHGTSREAILKKLKGNQARNQREATGQLPLLKRFALKMCSPCSYLRKGFLNYKAIEKRHETEWMMKPACMLASADYEN